MKKENLTIGELQSEVNIARERYYEIEGRHAAYGCEYHEMKEAEAKFRKLQRQLDYVTGNAKESL